VQLYATQELVSEEVREMLWKANIVAHAYRKLTARVKDKGKGCDAIGRRAIGFYRAIGVKVTAQKETERRADE